MDYDLIILGGGSAGYNSAAEAHQLGARVAVVDGSEELGGLCILRGCMPSKTLLYAADVLHHARHGADFGLVIPEARPDMAKVQERKRRFIKEWSGYRADQLQEGKFDLFREMGSFVDAHTIKLNTSGREITARKILIATGSVIAWPSVPGLSPEFVKTSDDILDLDYLPESVVVLGGGVVACELAQYLNRMGAKVTQIQRSPRILKEASGEAAAVVEERFRAEGIDLYTGTKLVEVAATADGGQVTFEHAGETKVVEGALIFNALGRRPATVSLNLAAAGVAVRPSGHVEADEWQQTSHPDVYAAGDCAGPHEIVHVAILQGMVAVRHALGQRTKPVNFDHLCSVVFTDPQVASVGMTEAKLAAMGDAVVSASYDFADHGKSILMEAGHGYVKVWAERATGKLLRAEVVGRDAGELIHAMVTAIALGATMAQLLEAHWYHPTLAEIWSYPIEDIYDELKGG